MRRIVKNRKLRKGVIYIVKQINSDIVIKVASQKEFNHMVIPPKSTIIAKKAKYKLIQGNEIRYMKRIKEAFASG